LFSRQELLDCQAYLLGAVSQGLRHFLCGTYGVTWTIDEGTGPACLPIRVQFAPVVPAEVVQPHHHRLQLSARIVPIPCQSPERGQGLGGRVLMKTGQRQASLLGPTEGRNEQQVVPVKEGAVR